MKKKKAKGENFIDVPPEVERELKEQEDAFNALIEEERASKVAEGGRPANLPKPHTFPFVSFRKGKKGREQIICQECKEVFVADINGDRLLFEDSNHRLLLVKFIEVLGVCNKCLETVWLLTEETHDKLVRNANRWNSFIKKRRQAKIPITKKDIL